MLNKGKNVNKIKIIMVALIVIAMTLGVYIKLRDKGKNVIEIKSIATDSFGHMKNEQLVLEAQKIDDNLYEIKLPKSVNSKTVNQITNVTLENKSNGAQENINVEVVDNKIQLTKEQMENYNINLGVQYDIVIKQQQEDETIKTIEVEDKTAEEIQELVENDNTEILYNKTLKHEETEKDSSVELKGKLPENAELQVEKLSEDSIKEIFGDTKISVAYDIKIINNGTTEINPEDFGEICEVSIKDANISTNSKVYHVKEDNTYEEVNVKENTEGNVSFNAQTFSVYAVSDDEIIPDEGEDLGVTSYIKFQYSLDGGSTWSAKYGGTDYTKVTVTMPDSGYLHVRGVYNTNGEGLCVVGPGATSSNCNSGGVHAGYGSPIKLTQTGSFRLAHYGSGGTRHSNGYFNATLIVTKPPTVTATTNSASWRNSALSTKITRNTFGVGDHANNVYQYYLSNSSTALQNGSWTNYTSGTAFNLQPATSLTAEQRSGSWYMFVKRIRNADAAYSTATNGTNQEVSSVTYHRFGAYNFDYVLPTISVNPSSSTWENSVLSVTITHNDTGDSGLASTSGTYFLSTNASPTEVAIGSALSGTYTSGTAFNINPGTTGQYYLFVQQISDNANNKSSTTDFVTINGVIYHRYGVYNFVEANAGTVESIGLEDATIKPIYRPEWEKVSSSIDLTDEDINGNGTLDAGEDVNSNGVLDTPSISIVLKGNASYSDTTLDDGKVKINYSSNVTSALTANDITVYINGVEATWITKVLPAASPATAEEVTQTLTLSGFEETSRQLGVPFKEWSGNIQIKIGGRGQAASTYTANKLVDSYGNQSMMETDQDGTNDDGTWIDVIYKDDDSETNANTSGTMFTDFIIPEFTYESSKTTIVGGDTETVTIIFDVTDKYFASTTLSNLDASQITIDVDDYDITELNNYLNTNNHKQLTKVEDITHTVNGVANTKVGERYQLVISGLDQGDAYKYSGYMTLSFAAGAITDKSGNASVATTITIGKDDVDGNPGQDTAGNGIVVDVVDPVWQLGDVDLTEGIIELITKDKYFDECTIDEDDIVVYVNGHIDGDTNKNGVIDGEESYNIIKDITSVTPTDITDTVNGVANTVVGKKYTLKLSNIVPSGGEYTDFTPTNLAELNNNAGFKYKSENGGTISLKIAAGVTVDKSENGNNVTTLDVGTIDVTVPEVYEVQKIQNASANTETIVFNVTDRNYDPDKIIALNEITLFFDNVQVDSLRNGATLTQKEIKLDIDGVTGKVLGHQYTLVIPNIAETVKQEGKDYLEYSGTLKMIIDRNAARDLKGNTLNTNTTTITDYIDYLKPQMEQITVTNPINASTKTYTMSFNVIDKYLYDSDVSAIDMITTDEITVYVDGEEASSITKNISNTPITATMNKTVDGAVTNATYTIGHTYTLVLGGFEQSSKQDGKTFMEWSGTVTAVIAQNATADTTGNTFDADVTKRTLTGEHVDFIKPVLEDVSSTRGTNNETIVFNVMDKYLANSNTDVISTDEITVYVDGEAVTVDYTDSSSTGLNGVLTKVQNFTHTVNGNTSHIVGQQYQLVLSGFEQASRNAKDYKDYSGTVTMEIAQNAVADTKGNTLDAAVAKRTVTGDFVDFIKPELEYTHSESDINHGTKTYTMTFDVTDKYYDSEDTNNVLTLDDLTITMDSEYSSVSDFDLKALAEQGKINIAFSKEEKTATFTKTVGGVVETTATSHIIGHTYTLTISNLDQLEIASGDTTVNYSGIITVVVAEDKLSDTGPAGDGTNPNKNVETQMISGVDVPGGSGSGTVVDVVSPLFDKVSSSAYAFNPTNKESSIGTITFKATDRYFVEGSGITIDDILVVVDGSVVSTGITKIIRETEELTEDRIISGTPQNDVQYGVEYTLEIKGWAQNAHQVKIRIPAEKLTDQYGNKNIETDLMVYNCLELTSSEIASNSGFLGNTNIDRQDVHNVTFLSDVSGAPRDAEGNIDIDNDECWDVSARNDKSIIAWRTDSVPYTVYIGSKDEIFANQNSTCLFAYIGHGSSSTATETITNIDSLNVRSVTNMTSMFEGCGADAMTIFTLGSNFNTSNVTKMGSMFKNFGKTGLASLSLGTQFFTNEVTDMSSMFEGCGTNAMTSLVLGENFNTTKVTTMNSMFKNCSPKITSINLGTQFDTSIVTDMGSMFEGFGTTSLTSLDLGNLFYTSKVTVTDMNNMFNGCGTTSMTALDLGPAFTKISTNHTNFMKDCGKSTIIIYAPESIYLNRTTLKTN